MEIRDDVKNIIDSDWEPKIPEDKVISEQVKKQIKKGKSSGNTSLDFKVWKLCK